VNIKKIDIKKFSDHYEIFEEYQLLEDKTMSSITKLVLKNNKWFYYNGQDEIFYIHHESLKELNNFVRKEKLEKLLS